LLLPIQGHLTMNGRWWLCLPAVVFCTVDAVLTLLGQDREYWAGELARVNEMNPVGYALLRWHPLAFIGGIVVWVVIFCAALLHLPLRAALVCGLGLTVAHTFGAATWVVRWESPYGIGLMAGVALLLTSDRVTWTCWKYFRRRHGHALRNSHTSEDLKRMFAHDAWANAEMAATLRSCNAPPARAVALLAHIVAAQRVWWGRLHRCRCGRS
jgi:hypothetical protein